MYNQRSAKVRQKEPNAVTIETVGGASFDGIVYVALGHRLADLLNDERHFIPVHRDDGSFIMLAKSQIVSILELNVEPDVFESEKPEPETVSEPAEEKPANRKFDPYVLLKVSPTASTEEIRAAYKARIKLVHPDSVASLGLEEDLAQAALRATQKLNFAYQKIMRERENESAEAAEARATA